MHQEPALTSADRRIRVEALNTLVDLARNGDDGAVQALRGIVTGYRGFDPEIYSRALNQLWLFGDDSLTDALLAALDDEAYGCQPWAANACGHLGVTAAEPLLTGLLRHPDGPVREAACRALGQLRVVTAVEPLARLLDDGAEFVRAAASDALADIGGREALEHLWSALRSRRRRAGYLAAALARFGPGVLDRLVQAAQDPDPDMRYWAARALGSTGADRAGAVLTDLAAGDHARTTSGAAVSTAAKRGLKTLRRLQEHRLAEQFAVSSEDGLVPPTASAGELESSA
ncbi:HEAT repeat domain-containing protein [Couchioplanes azureus]|uniref:HEAT repeat domain-containing protein n=1 Tax=Couchioplanes caeruleus TaxID=56438 RepID=UPI00166FB58B|nr:HEAT repeat domain-containing protein [Couchioplanes caeruleus]GGQ79077.1 hypothetical protein GCM10010166_56260 [Couchioplanes caeruleus subsp. azureus]